MNYIYQSEEGKARLVFEALHDEISPPESIGFSQAAGAFLEQYDSWGSAYEGCKAAYDVLLTTELNLDKLMPLCAFDKLFAKKLEQFTGRGNILDYVEAAELIYSQQQDLNGDGRPDWLMALSYPTLSPQAYIEVWAIIVTDTGTDVVKLTRLWAGEKKVEEILVEIHSLLPFNTPLITIASNRELHFLQLVKGEKGWEAKLHMNGNAIDYSLQMVENNLQLDLFFDPINPYVGIDHITYQWNAEMEKFVEINQHAPNSLGMRFDEALDSAEALIFQDGDFAAAIPILTTIANEFDPAEDSWWLSLPKTLYLLGLAHELQGDEMQAVVAYWRLWHDYPTSPYALIAVAKLAEE